MQCFSELRVLRIDPLLSLQLHFSEALSLKKNPYGFSIESSVK
jgi:hypothetical protein